MPFPASIESPVRHYLKEQQINIEQLSHVNTQLDRNFKLQAYIDAVVMD